MRRLSLVLLPVIFLSACLSSGYRNTAANLSLVINQVDSSRFPTTIGYVTTLNSNGYPVLGLGAESFQVTEDGTPVSGLRVSNVVNLQEPLAAVLTIDVSGSMTEADINAEKAAAISFIQALRPQDQVAVVAFSTEVRRLTEFTTDREAAISAINGLQPGGNTALYNALFESVDLTAAAGATRRVVVLMTDGINTASGAALDDGLNLAARQGTAVYTIGLGKDLDRNVLTRIAQKTGGTSLLAPSADDLHQAYDRIGTELRSQYLLSYTSPRPRGARDYQLSVRVAAEGDQARAEVTYRPAPPVPAISSISLRDGQTITETVNVEVQTASQVPVSSVRLRVNGRPQAETASPPYVLPLDPSRFSAGRHEVTVTVVDAAGSEATTRLHAVIPAEAAGTDLPAEAPVLPSVSLPEISLPGVVLPELSLPQIGLPEVTMPEIPDLISPVQDWGQEMLSQVNGIIGGWLDSAQATAQDNAHRFPPASLAFAAAVGGLLQIRKLFGGLRAGLRHIHCYTCGASYRSYLGECPACLEDQRQREFVSRGLEELLLQNNLVEKDRLAEAVQTSKESGRALEEIVLERELMSASDLTRARYYLAHSVEIQSRLKDVLDARAVSRPLPVPRRLLAVRGIAILVAVGAFGLTLPMVLS